MSAFRTTTMAMASIGLLMLALAQTVRAEEPAGDVERAVPATAYSMPGIEIGGHVGEGGGSGEVNVIVPLALRGSAALFYLGADAELFSGGFNDFDDSVYNVGAYFGYRHRVGNGAVVGAWLGADTLETEYGHAYQRFIAGAEYYGDRVIARVNGFAPFDDTSSTWSETTSTTTTSSYVVTTPTELVTHQRTATRTVTSL